MSHSQTCADCLQRYANPAPRCRTCATRLPMSSLRQCGSCLRHPPPVDRTIAALDYACPWDRLLQHFKFNDGIELHERAANMHQAFAVEPARQRDLRGSHVAIVDDVMTRGATLFELARVLRRAGATKVQAWVIARTPGPKD